MLLLLGWDDDEFVDIVGPADSFEESSSTMLNVTGVVVVVMKGSCMYFYKIMTR